MNETLHNALDAFVRSWQANRRDALRCSAKPSHTVSYQQLSHGLTCYCCIPTSRSQSLGSRIFLVEPDPPFLSSQETIAKPISNTLKQQAKEYFNTQFPHVQVTVLTEYRHESFRRVCVNLAQGMYRTEAKLRTTLLGEPVKTHRPLSETRRACTSIRVEAIYNMFSRAIENGANALAEGFLFAVAASLIVAETWRSSRSTSKRRDDVDEQLENLSASVQELVTRVDGLAGRLDEGWEYERQKYFLLSHMLVCLVTEDLLGTKSLQEFLPGLWTLA
jgi:hypothetical protein